MIKIYGVSQSRAARSLWAADECGIEFEHVKVNFGDDSKKSEYLAINPNGRVPALADGDLVLFESMAINLYLARRYGGALMPGDEADQARTIQWSVWGMTEIEPHMIPIVVQTLMTSDDERDNDAIAEHNEALKRPLAVLDQSLSGKSYLLGDAFTIADLNVAAALMFARMVKYDLSPWPEVKRWFEVCTSRPAFEKATTR